MSDHMVIVPKEHRVWAGPHGNKYTANNKNTRTGKTDRVALTDLQEDIANAARAGQFDSVLRVGWVTPLP